MKARAEQGADEGLWIRAETQNGGIGRLGRKWESPKGNLFCSGLADIRSGDPISSSLSFVAALAVFETIRSYLPDTEMQLKWPNDVLVSGAKICGILLERVGNQIVVGIGINVAIAPPVDGRPIMSIHQAGATHCTAEKLIEELATAFARNVDSWRSFGLASTLSEWQKHAHPIGAIVSTSAPHGGKISGEFAGLAEDGALRLRKADDTLIEIRAGDIELG